jgi:large subunit ribosomal protein L29
MKAELLRTKTAEELSKELLILRRAQFGLRMQAATQQLSNTSQIDKLRKTIARIKTIQTEKGKGK